MVIKADDMSSEVKVEGSLSVNGEKDEKSNDRDQKDSNNSEIKVILPDGETLKGRAFLGSLVVDQDHKNDIDFSDMDAQCEYEKAGECNCEDVSKCSQAETGIQVIFGGDWKEADEVLACREGIEGAVDKFFQDIAKEGLGKDLKELFSDFQEHVEEKGTGEPEKDIASFLRKLFTE